MPNSGKPEFGRNKRVPKVTSTGGSPSTTLYLGGGQVEISPAGVCMTGEQSMA